MAAKRSKPCKTVNDWFFLGQLININEACAPVLTVAGSNLRYVLYTRPTNHVASLRFRYVYHLTAIIAGDG